MSKRLKNYPDPVEVINSYGADALRLYLINSPVVRAEVLKFTSDGVNDVVRGVLLPWYNAFRFFIQCVQRWEHITGTDFVPDVNKARASTNDVDVWILAATMGLVKFVHEEMKAYRLYTVVPRLLNFIEELTNWYVRLNRDRLKGSMGDLDAIQGMNVLYEVLMVMTQIMSPFTPFFAEYLYQNLRKLQPMYGNTDSSVPDDVIGKANSVHYLMLPEVNEANLNPRAEARFKTLQTAVTLVRIARERRHIRNNLPLKDVLVVAANDDDIEALTYLKSYFMGECNAWGATMSTEWEKLCVLKVQPDFKTLGKRLGSSMKAVQKAVAELTHKEIVDFMHSGKMTLCGFDFTKDDIVVKREFSGDTKKYEACVSDDGSIMVAIDTTIDEEIFQELRARQLAATVQKMRKSSGLVVADTVEVFYEEEGSPLGGQISQAIMKHASATVKRIRVLPLPLGLKSKNAINIVKEVVKDNDISKSPVTIVLTRPVVAVDLEAVAALVSTPINDVKVETITMHIQTMDYDSVMALQSVAICLESSPSNINVVLKKGEHYFGSVWDLVSNSKASYLQEYKYLPTAEALK